jgi:hypothetical protein
VPDHPAAVNAVVPRLVSGRGVDLDWSRLSHFQRGVVFRNPVFDFNVKLFCLDDDLFASGNATSPFQPETAAKIGGPATL